MSGQPDSEVGSFGLVTTAGSGVASKPSFLEAVLYSGPVTTLAFNKAPCADIGSHGFCRMHLEPTWHCDLELYAVKLLCIDWFLSADS